ncbi:MAG TPA: HAD-IA family hydrolase, partial [Kofleriaceae bacterium]|jgi:beta-phosphoglucomutase|nr:HAD-IA family hydrolase [Kofleriaceae bacterium]
MSFTLLFDLDGTLLDTDPLHFQAYLGLLEEHARPAIDFALYRTRIMGFGHAEIFAMLFPDRDPSSHAELAEHKEARFRALLRDTAVDPRPGLVELLDWADARGIRCGVVTNAPRENAMLMLDALRLAERFEAAVFGEELSHPKPHPMPYLTGLAKLGGHADRALAFEDSLSGVRSASGAQIYTVGVQSSLSAEALREAGASHTIDDFRDDLLWSELRRRTDEAANEAANEAARRVS